MRLDHITKIYKDYKTAKDFAAVDDVSLDIVSVNSINDENDMESLIENAINSGSEAIITEPTSNSSINEVLRRARTKIPIVLTHSDVKNSDMNIPVVEADCYQMGKKIALEIEADYGKDLSGKKCGLILGKIGTEAADNAKKGFLDEVKKTGLNVKWTINDKSLHDNSLELLKVQSDVDFVVSLSDFGMKKATQSLEEKKLSASYVYGIGCSETVCVALDKELAKCFIAPDEFSIGYRALDMISNKLSGSSEMEDEKVSYKVMRRDNLFDEENQNMFYYLLQ